MLTLSPQYVLPLVGVLINNLKRVTLNRSARDISTRGRLELLKQVANLTSYQRGVY